MVCTESVSGRLSFARISTTSQNRFKTVGRFLFSEVGMLNSCRGPLLPQESTLTPGEEPVRDIVICPRLPSILILRVFCKLFKSTLRLIFYSFT